MPSMPQDFFLAAGEGAQVGPNLCGHVRIHEWDTTFETAFCVSEVASAASMSHVVSRARPSTSSLREEPQGRAGQGRAGQGRAGQKIECVGSIKDSRIADKPLTIDV